MLNNISNKLIPYRMNLNWLAKRWGLDVDEFSQALTQLVNIDGLKVYTDYQGYAIYGFYGYTVYESPCKYGFEWHNDEYLHGWYSKAGGETTKNVFLFPESHKNDLDYPSKLIELDNIRFKAYLNDRERCPELVEIHGRIEPLNYVGGKVEIGSLYIDESIGDDVYVRLTPISSQGEGQEALYKRTKLILDLDKAFIYRDDLKLFEQSQNIFNHGLNIEQQNISKAKPLDTRERNSYLSFINSLADYHGIDITKITAKQLAITKEEGKNFSISENTVLKILKELKET